MAIFAVIIALSLIIWPLIFVIAHSLLKNLNLRLQSRFLGKIVAGFEGIIYVLLKRNSPRGFVSEPLYSFFILLVFTAMAAFGIVLALRFF
jgi:hypothetical protein